MNFFKILLSVCLMSPLVAFSATDIMMVEPVTDPIPEPMLLSVPTAVPVRVIQEDDMVMCTMDAKICPDGSGVGRIAPDCEFALCPGELARIEYLDDDSDDDGLIWYGEVDNDCDDDDETCNLKTDLELREEQLKLEVELKERVVCTMDAKICPDGSGVGRVGPNCEFALCPEEQQKTIPQRQVCTEEAKMCPDGTAVGRSGPNCEFALCPSEKGTISIKKPAESIDETYVGLEISVDGEKLREQVQAGTAEVKGWDPIKKQVTLQAQEVASKEDLHDFTQAVIIGNERIKEIKIEEDIFKLEYKEPAKLFGFINVEMNAKVEVDEVGEVKVKFPWYKFLTTSKASESKEQIIDALEGIEDTDVVEDIGDMAETDMLQMQNTLQKQAQMIQTLSNIMKALSDTQDDVIDNIK